jgi:hypothetical protein
VDTAGTASAASSGKGASTPGGRRVSFGGSTSHGGGRDSPRTPAAGPDADDDDDNDGNLTTPSVASTTKTDISTPGSFEFTRGRIIADESFDAGDDDTDLVDTDEEDPDESGFADNDTSFMSFTNKRKKRKAGDDSDDDDGDYYAKDEVRMDCSRVQHFQSSLL